MQNGFTTVVPSKRPKPCDRCPGRTSGVCSGFSKSDLSALAYESTVSTIEAGTTIIEQDARLGLVGFIVSGIAKVAYITSDGSEHILQLLYPGQLVGDPQGSHNMVSWEAATDLTLCWLPIKSLNSLMVQHPGLYRGYLKLTYKQRELGQLWTAELRGRSTVQRMAYWLVTQAHQSALGKRSLVHIALSRIDLASYLNMSSEALCRALQQLAGRKAIAKITPELIEIRDFAKLRVLARCTEDRVVQALSANSRLASVKKAPFVRGMAEPPRAERYRALPQKHE